MYDMLICRYLSKEFGGYLIERYLSVYAETR